MSDDIARQAFVAEALALHDRYQRDVIEALAICPWAKHARVSGRTRAHVVADSIADERELEPVVRAWSDDQDVDVGFLILPRFEGGFEGLERWGQRLVDRVDKVFFSAPFHPAAPPDAGPVRFFRQSPDPTIQLVRRNRLEEVRAEDPPHYTDIFDLTLDDLQPGPARKTAAATVLDHNRRLLERQGRASLERRFPTRGHSSPRER